MVSTAARSAGRAATTSGATGASRLPTGARTPGVSHLTSAAAGRRSTRGAHGQSQPSLQARSTSPEVSPVLRAQAAAELLGRADAELLAAQLASDPAERFGHAHMAALRVAGAVLAVLGSRPPRGRTRSAWERLAADAEGFAPWASFFASGARLRSAIDAGRFDAVDETGAARWVAAAEDFRDEVGLWVEDDDAPLARSVVLAARPVSA